MNPAAIQLGDVGKRYVKYEDEPMLVTRMMRWRQRTRRSPLWAVRHVSLDLTPGQSLGVIGRNGSGKSTLLQLLAGVTAPTEGSVTVRGRVAPLVAVGVGFHPELTGRENVYVNGTILGLSRAEIARRFDAIVAFSGIEEFIDTPVKFYSSGMYVRLGFAVAVEATPDVLLVDEVLAVGDIGFQVRCFRRMAEIREAGTTVVVVSHNLNAIRQLCDRALVLHDGAARHDGDVDEGIALYHDLLGEFVDPDSPTHSDVSVERGTAEVVGLRLLDGTGGPAHNVGSGELVTVELEVRYDRPVQRPLVGIACMSASGVNVYSETTGTRVLPAAAAGDRRLYRMRLRLPLSTGSYTLHSGVYRVDSDDYDTTQLHEARLTFYVAGRAGFGGLVDLAAQFDTDGGGG